MNPPLNQVICGDSREVLKDFPENFFSAVCTDPPYELTSGNSKKGFMGKAWDGSGVAFDVNLWQECLRVLRPGGYLLAFGGSRTYHRMACAIEDAGFILHPMIGWVFGQGFPKAANLSKMLDKDAGAERQVIGKMLHPRANINATAALGGAFQESPDLTIPSTSEAKQWDGWYYGRQSLKPALEPICMAQKPPEGRMIDNIRAWGCGGIAIDKCRIGTDGGSTLPSGYDRYNAALAEQGYRPNTYQKGEPPAPLPAGRWPANLILSHSPNCVKVGRKKIKGNAHFSYKPADDGGLYKLGLKQLQDAGNPFADATGHEEIDDYVCSEDCPVRLMGEQSGICKSGGTRPDGINRKSEGNLLASKNVIANNHIAPSSGTAARFFLNIEPEPFFYCPKASSSERNLGLDALTGKMPERYGEMKGTPEHGPNRQNLEKNFHPTVKPLKLMRYLCRLITPPGGLILDPFAGSGTTLCAAKLEGFEATGIELNQEYITIAEARLAAYKPDAQTAFQS